ncbi:MAG: spore cortex-lytic protein [Clostridia bacterium]|nr:spore cortex-lytic protein [Clostridia bacterium]
MAESTLQVRAVTSRAWIPVRNATVVVTQDDGSGAQQLLALRTTDRSGLAEQLTVQAPPREESTSPNAGEEPFSEAAVTVDAAGYYRIRVNGVQLFAQVLTEQIMMLLPESEDPYLREEEEQVFITPQAL